MTRGARTYSLMRRHAAWLLAALLAMELVALGLFVGLAMWPMAQRAAHDLGGLMVLSAQTWTELPPATRPAFEQALRAQHGLKLTAEPFPTGQADWHPPFYFLLEAALEQRLGAGLHLFRVPAGEEVWYWARIPTGGRVLGVGLSSERINSQPLLAVGLALLIGVGVAWLLAAALVRQVAQPLRQLTQATERVGAEEVPTLLPDAGPAEVVALIQHFNQMAVRVRELLSARALLLSGVSHDLRTPLARMQLALELMRTQPSGAWLDRMERDLNAMDALIANVLALSRGQRPEPVQAQALRPALADLAQGCRERGCPVELQLPPEWTGVAPEPQPEPVWQVPTVSLQRALGNLLDNACQHGQGQAVQLRLSLLPRGACRLEVSDRGSGIPEADIEGMFEPFRRADPARQAATGGVGLGLAIVRELAKAHGWRVGLSPREGGGMTAWLALPAHTVLALEGDEKFE